MWGATTVSWRCATRVRNFNPRAPCGARPRELFGDDVFLDISIHAPRVGRDFISAAMSVKLQHFNPRAPCGARPHVGRPENYAKAFQSTRPVWGATWQAAVGVQGRYISIHAPRVGRDRTSWMPSKKKWRTARKGLFFFCPTQKPPQKRRLGQRRIYEV